jgi:hypothetical protein
LAGVELSKNISQDRACQAQCNSINSSLSHFKTIFKNFNGDAAKTPGRDGRLQGLMKQFFQKYNAEILSIFCLCPSVEFMQENNSVLDFCKVRKVNTKYKHIYVLN